MTGLRAFVKTSVRFTGHGNIQLSKRMTALPEEQIENMFKDVKNKSRSGEYSHCIIKFYLINICLIMLLNDQHKNATAQQGHNKVLRPIRLGKMCPTGDEFKGVNVPLNLVWPINSEMNHPNVMKINK